MNSRTSGAIIIVDVICFISALRLLYNFFSTEPHNYWYLAGTAALLALVVVPLLLNPKNSVSSRPGRVSGFF